MGYKVGGNLIFFTVTNNFCGHGFHQLSPEQFYSVLSEESGFAIEKMIALEHDSSVARTLSVPVPALYVRSRWSVPDRRKAGRRVERVDDQPTLLMVQARRVARTEILSRQPKPSDYHAIWEAGSHARRRLHPARRFLAGALFP